MDTLMLVGMGGLAGVMAGLLGIGGGALIVPVLVMVFERQAINPDIMMQLALGTSMATIVFTAISSILAHQRRGAVDWKIFWQITPGIVFGSLAGAVVADFMSTRALMIVFVCFMSVIAIQMARGTMATAARAHLPGAIGVGSAGTVIGLLSSLVGIGGGSLSVPFMTLCSVPVKRAIATASAIGLPIAIGGTIGYVAAGLNEPGLPQWSVGYVVLPAFAGVVTGSTLAAPFGARLAHRLSDVTLRRIFAVFVTILAARMLWRLLQ